MDRICKIAKITWVSQSSFDALLLYQFFFFFFVKGKKVKMCMCSGCSLLGNTARKKQLNFEFVRVVFKFISDFIRTRILFHKASIFIVDMVDSLWYMNNVILPCLILLILSLYFLQFFNSLSFASSGIVFLYQKQL